MKQSVGIIFGIVIIIILLANISAQGEQQNAKAEKIFLKSKIFVPSEKIPVQAQNKISAAIQQKGKAHVLIQLNYLPSEEEKQKLAQDGIILLNYIPDRAWLASIKNFNSAAQRADITFIDSLNAQDKIDPDLQKEIPNYAKNSDGTSNFSVMFFDDTSKEEIESLLANYNATFIPPFRGDIWTVKISENKLNNFAAEEIVHWVEAIPAPFSELNNASRAGAGVNTVQAPPYNLNGSGVTLAEWDSGWGNHSDFNSRKTIGDQGHSITQHSTHVAGTMLGDGNNSWNKGFANSMHGMSANATLLTYEWPDSGANELYNESNLSVTNYDAVLSQNSWAYNTAGNCGLEGKYDSLTQAYDNVIYGNTSIITGGKQLIVVFAAGNERSNTTGCIGVSNGADNDGYGSVPGPGATAKNTIAVGAISNYFWPDPEVWPNNLYFTSWGPTRDGRLKPEVVAHGDAVRSTNNVDDGYVVLTGTSMAAPGVSGTIGLMMQAYRNINNNASFKSATAKALLVHTARDLNNTGPDFPTGYGLINATRAVDLILRDNSTNSTDVIIENNVTNSTRTYYVRYPEGQTEFKVTLAWDDAPGTVAAAKELVNDLDLVVTAPNGTRMFPWTLSNATRTLNASRNQTNTIDNLEQVLVNDSVPAGIWTVAVNASVAVGARQNFSLVSNNALFADNITWNTTLIEINATQGSTSTGTALVLSFTQNNNSNVSEISGNGTTILSENATTLGNLVVNSTPLVQFTCAPTGANSVGVYEALYFVNSSNNTQGGANLTVKCDVKSPPSPVVSIMIPSANNTSTNDNTPTITFNFTDEDNTTGNAVLYFNSTARANNESARNNTPTNLTSTALTDGIYNFWVNVSDNISNISSAINQIIIDLTIPPNVSGVTFSARDAGWINLTWTLPTDASGINHTEVWRSDVFQANVSAPTNYTNQTGLTASTAYTFQLRAVDNAGNIGNWTNTSLSTTADTSNPSPSLNSPSAGASTESPVTFNCSATDNYALSNISLWADFAGNWTLNETKNISGVDNSTTFSKTLAAGTYIWNCMANDTSANSAFGTNRTLTITAGGGGGGSSGAGGGGGGGGGGVALPSESKALGNIPPGTPALAIFEKVEQHYIEQIRFEAVSEAKNAIIKVTRLNDRSAATTKLDADIFAYLNIETINFKPAQIKNVELQFVVNKSWVAQKKYSPENILLMEFEKTWYALQTKKIGENSEQYIYNAQNASFSYFAISAVERAEKMAEENITALEIAEEKENVSNISGAPRGEAVIPTYAIVIVVAIIVSVAAAIVFLHWKKA